MSALDAHSISALLATRIAELARDLLPNGSDRDGTWRVGGLDGERGGSLAISLVRRPGLWIDHATDESGDALDLVKGVHRCETREALEWSRRWLGIDRGEARQPTPMAPRPLDAETETRAMIARALSIFSEAETNIAATPICPYFQARRLDLPENCEDWLRFDAACPFGPGMRVPCLIALFRDNLTDEACGIQRSAIPIWPDVWSSGRKIDRKMLGHVKGASVKIDGNADVLYGLHVAEGVESALAARQCGFRPIWAAGSKGAIASFPILPEPIQSLTIFQEPDAVAEVEACARLWREAGREAIVVTAMAKDMNAAIVEAS